MRIQDLFDFTGSADELLSYFDNVTSPQQLVSRLEQLKRQDPEGLFDSLESLRLSHATVLEANLELGGALANETDEPDNLLGSLAAFAEATDETVSQIATDEKPPEVENSSSQDAK
jgi:Flp pilus assembly CpaE family ATPase